MQPRCSCGALLPEDARFCHKCGKPQYEEDLARLSEPAPEPVALRSASAPAADHAARIGFSNLRAVAITGAVAACSMIGFVIVGAIAPLLIPLVLCGAGFAAVKFYKSRMAQPVTPFNGATLGVMTGFWLFLIMLLCFALISISISSPEGHEILKALSQRVPDLAKLVDDPHQMIVILAKGLIAWFFILTISAAFGGLLAARFEARSGRPS